jgi:dolichyl-phosphate-mannose-protein mannosyltransferase
MIFPALLLVLSAITHFAYFGWPRAVVFDEVYFTTFVGDYSKASYYFDIHPPLAKLIAMFFGKLVGATYDVDMSAIGNTLPWGVVLLRLLPIVAGTLLPIVIYFICRRLNFSKLVSFAAGMLIILENSILVQSRFVLFDSIMLLFGFTAILLYFIYIKRAEEKKSGWWLVLLSALCTAGAFSIKWTGLAFALLILVAEIWRAKKVQTVLKFFTAYAIIGLIVYLSVFAVHFAYLTHSGPGDPFMTDRFQKTLIGSAYEKDPTIKPKGFFGKTIELNVEMLHANQTLTSTHPYSSKWYTWPLMIRSVFYWQGKTPDANGGNEYIYLFGNPFVYWLGTLAILFLLWEIIIKKLRDKKAFFIVIGYLVNFLPFILIGRVMFLYHYEAALVFSILAIVYSLEKYVPIEKRKIATYSMLFLCLASFIFFAPLSYGIYLSDSMLHARMWLGSWR